MNNKFYTCKYDRPFKEVMLNKNNEDLLKWYMEDILKVKIESMEVNTIEMESRNIHVRRKYADVILNTDVGKIEIEVNACNENYVKPRNMSYLCNIYSNHTLIGSDYSEDVPIIQINFSYGLKDKEKIREYKIQDDSRKEYVKNFTIYEINMEYYKEIWDNGNEEEIEKNKYYIMLDLEEKDLKKISKKDRMVEKYMEDIVKVNSNPEFQAFMTYEEDQEKIYNSRMRAATEKGLKEGLEQGLQQGLEQGRQESCIEIAKNMKEIGISLEDIVKVTSLSLEEVEKL